eukprot:9316284-Ditylum_brightwellii.AAC.1
MSHFQGGQIEEALDKAKTTLASSHNTIVVQKTKHKNKEKCSNKKSKKDHQDAEKVTVRKAVPTKNHLRK